MASDSINPGFDFNVILDPLVEIAAIFSAISTMLCLPLLLFQQTLLLALNLLLLYQLNETAWITYLRP